MHCTAAAPEASPAMKSERLRFPGGQAYQLEGRLDLPDAGPPLAYAIFAHCFGCTKNLKSITYLDRALTDAGIGVLRFDFTGLGESGGDFADTNFSTNVWDVVAAAHFLDAHYAAPRLLIGHSFGGPAVMQAARLIPSAAAVVTIAAPADLAHLGDAILGKAPDIEETGEAEVVLVGRRFRIKKQFLDDLAHNSMAEVVGGLRLPLLILHAPADEIVPAENAARIFAMARQPKSLVALDGADHLLLDERDARYAGEVIATWYGRYLEV